MTSRDQQQADLLQAYRAALAHDPDAPPPAGLDPLYTQMARGLESLRPPAPDAAALNRVRNRIEREMAQATAKRCWVLGVGRRRLRTNTQHPTPNTLLRPALGMAAVLVLAVAAGLLTQALRPRGVSAAEVIARARSAEGGFHSFVVTETAEARAAGAPAGSGRVRSEITRWYEAPGRWRREVASLVIGPDGQAVRGTGLTSVSDGDTVWIHRAGDNVVMVRAYTPDGSTEEIGPFPEVTGGLAPLLDQVAACYTPHLRGRDAVAGRAAFVIDLGRSRCPADAEAGAQPADWTVWVDTETYLILKSVQMLDGTPVYTSTVTNVQYNVPIDRARFDFALPAGARVRDTRPGR